MISRRLVNRLDTPLRFTHLFYGVWGDIVAKAIDIIKGLEILGKYATGGTDEHIGGAGHDIIWGLPVDEEKVTEEDRAKLEEHGLHTGGGEEGWYHYA